MSLINVKIKNKEYVCKTIKNNHTFNKDFKVELRDIMKSKTLSKNARCFLGTMTPFISFPTNTIIIDSENPSIAKISEILGFKTRAISYILSELEKEDIICRKKVNGSSIIYVNPFLYCSGAYVEKSTYDLFCNSKFNNIKNTESKNNKLGFVYFIQLVDQNQNIKIGYTNNIEERIKTLQISSPYEIRLLGFMKGNISLEKSIQKMFANIKILGEWFHPSKELIEFINKSATSY